MAAVAITLLSSTHSTEPDHMVLLEYKRLLQGFLTDPMGFIVI